MILNLTQNDITPFIKDRINDSIEISLKGETLTRTVENYIRTKLKTEIEHYLNSYTVRRMVESIIDSEFKKEPEIIKKIVYNLLIEKANGVIKKS